MTKISEVLMSETLSVASCNSVSSRDTNSASCEVGNSARKTHLKLPKLEICKFSDFLLYESPNCEAKMWPIRNAYLLFDSRSQKSECKTKSVFFETCHEIFQKVNRKNDQNEELSRIKDNQKLLKPTLARFVKYTCDDAIEKANQAIK